MRATPWACLALVLAAPDLHVHVGLKGVVDRIDGDLGVPRHRTGVMLEMNRQIPGLFPDAPEVGPLAPLGRNLQGEYLKPILDVRCLRASRNVIDPRALLLISH